MWEFLSPVSVVFLGLGSLMSLVFLVLMRQSRSYEEYTTPLKGDKMFPLSEMYTVGFLILDKSDFNYRNRRNNQLRQDAAIIYGEKYADYYARCLKAQEHTFTILVALAVCLLAGVGAPGDLPMLLGVGGAFVFVTKYYFSTKYAKRIKTRSKELLSSFPDAIAMLALLINSGMVVREAWETVAQSGEGPLYQEMQMVTEKIENGYSDIDAIFTFGVRSSTPEIQKFVSFIIQGIEKGNKELSAVLSTQTKEIWEIKKQNVMQQGELAAGKMIIPLALMFIGILIMVIVPIFTNLGM